MESSILHILITILIVLAAIVLVLVVLVQNSKGGGLASAFSSSNSVMGVRKTTDFVEKATWGLAGFIIVMSLLSTKVVPSKGTSSLENMEIPGAVAPTQQGAPDVTSPQAPTQGTPVETPIAPQQ